MHTASTNCTNIVYSVLTWFQRKSNRVASSQFVQDNVPDKTSIVSGNLQTSLQSNGNSFSTELLIKLNFVFYNGLGICNIVLNDL